MSQVIILEEIVAAVVSVLISNNIEVISRENSEANLRSLQEKLLRKESLSISEVLKGKFFPHISTANGIKNQLKTGKIKQDDWFLDKKKRYRILTSVLKPMLEN